MEHFYAGIHGCFTFAHFYEYVAVNFHEFHGVEVGALYGQSAAHLATELLTNGPKRVRLDLVELSDNRAQLRANLSPVSHAIGMIHSPCSSVEASKAYADESLDFVMLDAGHELADVREDIAHWWPKVKPGGILAGHDFSHYFPGVMRAALEAFPRLNVWAGSLWPDDSVHGQRRIDAENDIANRSATHEKVDYMPTWWVRK
jgi:hypothetical protein